MTSGSSSTADDILTEIEAVLQKQRRQEYNLFISHSWSHDDEYERMVELLEDFPYFEFKNYSVPSTNPLDIDSDEELVLELKEQIEPASVVIILAGMYVSYSTAIELEMMIADFLGKPMLGVKPRGNENVPTEVQEQVDEMVGWTGHSVVGGVRELSD